MAHQWDPRVGIVVPPVVPARIDPTGRTGPTRGQAAGPRWRRTSRGLYVPSDAPMTPEQRIIEAALLIRGRAVVTGWAALRLHGANFFDGLEPDGRTSVPVAMAANGERMRSADGLVVARQQVPEAEVVIRHGIRCAIVERALFDEMWRRSETREGAVAFDMTAAAELTSLSRMRAYLAKRAGSRGRALVASALAMGDEESRSPQESRFRMIWEYDAGWGRPLCNRLVYTSRGRLLGTPDLLDPVRGVVGEYDGADHRTRDRHTRDVRRMDDFRRVGLEYVAVVGQDLRDVGLVVARIHAAGDRAGSQPRAWALGPPPMTLDERLLDRD